jgi:poly(glycerol-phosphate) alpha-glucosyltransferase
VHSKNVAIICPWASRAGGGLQSSVRDLALAMAEHCGTQVTCVSNADQFTETDARLWHPIVPRLHPYSGPESLRFSMGMLRDVATLRTDILQLHGVWMFPSVAVRWRKLYSGVPLIISPHGMLDPWILSRGRAKKALARAVYEGSNWRKAAAFRALNATEADAVRLVAPKASIAVIPNGIVNPGPAVVAEAMARRRAQGGRRFLFLGRLHEKKGVLETIAAWRRLIEAQPSLDAELRIAGWGDPAYEAQVKEAAAAAPKVSFLGGVFGEQKGELLRGSTDFILASHSEGLPMAVLEACAYGLVPLISDQCNLPALHASGIALRAQPDVDSIANALREALALGEAERDERAQAAHRFVEKDYSWQAIATDLDRLQDDVLAGRRPS